MNKKRLGKGLSALIPDTPKGEENQQAVVEMELSRIIPNPHQPRQSISRERLEELASSIREHGVLQPIIVKRDEEGHFFLVAGERRFRAAGLAGLHTIPVIIKELSPAEVMEIALIENLQREDLNPVEEAMAYKQLIDEHKFTQEQLAKRLGKSRPAITNTLRLLHLPQAVQDAVVKGRLSMGHARSLLSLQDEKKILQAAAQVMEKGLSVRATEELTGNMSQNKPPGREKSPVPGKVPQLHDPLIRDLEEQLRHYFGCQVRIKRHGQTGGGKVEVAYFNEEELGRIVELILQDEESY